MKVFVARLMAGLAVLGIPAAAVAHHSAAMFDLEKDLTVNGTVKDFQYTKSVVGSDQERRHDIAAARRAAAGREAASRLVKREMRREIGFETRIFVQAVINNIHGRCS